MTSKKNSVLVDEFMVEFQRTKSEIVEQIEGLTEGLGEELNAISLKIQDLTKKLHESTKFLPSYTAKMRLNDISALEKKLKDKEEELKPKPKFGFKNLKSVSSKSKPIEDANVSRNHVNPPEDDDVDYNFMADQNYMTIENVTDDKVVFDEDKLNRHDVMVRNLENKEVVLIGSPSTLRIYNLKNCKLLCGPVQTSTFVENCSNCTLVLCCQQLRTHSSNELDIYLRVTSRAIIEDCTKIRFAPYAWKHPKLSELHKVANINEDLERYDAVDDFNWLVFNTPSPNWQKLPEDERMIFS